MQEKKPARRFSREFKLAAIRRVQNGEMQAAVARELQIKPAQLANWRQRLRLGGEGALREPGRPAGKAGVREAGREKRTSQLERLVGQQQAAIDFLEQALRRVEELRRKKNDDGATASSE